MYFSEKVKEQYLHFEYKNGWNIKMDSDSQYKEIWIDSDEQGIGATICALINGDKGWLMYLRYHGDAGFSSRNPNYSGDENATLEFELSNGQLDEYPLSWVLPIDEVNQALTYFAKYKKPPKFIKWHSDCGEDLE